MPIRFQIASDVIRDGLGIELLDEENAVLAEVFRHDANHQLTVTFFRENIPFVFVERLVNIARQRLGPFEDGAPLPLPEPENGKAR